MSPVGAIFVPFLPKTGTKMLHPLPPPIVELVTNAQHIAMVTTENYLYDPNQKWALDFSQTKHIAFDLQTAAKVQTTDFCANRKQ